MKNVKTILEWNDKEFNAALKLDLTKRMAVGCLEVEKVVKLSMGSGGPSAPGEPPHVQSGRLRASISSNWTGSGRQAGKVGSWKKQPKEGQYWAGNVGKGVENPGGQYPLITGVVGTDVEYSRDLEQGNRGRNLAPRPYLRPALDSCTSALRKIFGVK